MDVKITCKLSPLVIWFDLTSDVSLVQMVGVGTSEVNLEKFKYSFGSLLGHDEDSWGLSYTGQ